MKKFGFWIGVIVAFLLFIRILVILILDFKQLTQYGFGYLTGLSILFIVLILVLIWLGKKKIISNKL